jgi:hypothetical protein
VLHKRKEALFVFVALASLIFCVFILLTTTNTIANVSAVETNGVGVYWNSNCTNKIFSINWGTLTPGSLKNIVVYIRNEGEEPIFLMMSTTNWNPPKASKYITLKWNYTGGQINPGKVLQITQRLCISRYIEGISSYSFDIIINGSQHLVGDVNGDGKVSLADVGKLKLIYSGLIPGPPYIDPTTGKELMPDINGDGKVSMADIGKLKLILSQTL